MATLLERIEEARKAQGQVDAMAAVQEKADELPGLLKQQEREQRIEVASIRLEQTRATVKVRLEEAQSGASKFREAFAELATEFAALVEAMPGLQAVIMAAGHDLQNAVELAYRAEHGNEPRDPQQATGIPPEMQDRGNLAMEWEQAGGNDPALACLPYSEPGSIAYLLAELLQRKSVPAYNPAQGARVFTRIY